MPEFNAGISLVALSPTEPGVVYGMASGERINASLFWVKEGRLFETRLTGHDWALSRSIHLTSKREQVIWLNTGSTVFFKPKEYTPTKFVVSNRDYGDGPYAINQGGFYNEDRGMFIAGMLQYGQGAFISKSTLTDTFSYSLDVWVELTLPA